jgi:HEAT repeat protein
MMRSNGMLIALELVFAGCALFCALQPREPVYQGKSFSVLAKDLYPKRPLSRADLSLFFQKRDQANNAVRQMGTKALPYLVKMLHQKDSFLKVQLMKLAAKQNVIRIFFTPASTINQGAAQAIVALGKVAKPAIPDLIKTLERSTDVAVRSTIASGLGNFGSAAKDAVNVLTRTAIIDIDDSTRNSARSSLRAIGPASKEGLPIALQYLHHSDQKIHAAAAATLFVIDPSILDAMANAMMSPP